MTTKQTTPCAKNYGLQAYWTRQTNTERNGFYTYKECHKTEFLENPTSTDRKEEDQLDDLKNVGESNYNPREGTDQRVQSLVFMMTIFE